MSHTSRYAPGRPGARTSALSTARSPGAIVRPSGVRPPSIVMRRSTSYQWYERWNWPSSVHAFRPVFVTATDVTVAAPGARWSALSAGSYRAPYQLATPSVAIRSCTTSRRAKNAAAVSASVPSATRGVVRATRVRPARAAATSAMAPATSAPREYVYSRPSANGTATSPIAPRLPRALATATAARRP
jgi:hypothetical protein